MRKDASRVVVIAGGTRGIGFEITRAFSESGDYVVVGARRGSPEIERLENVSFVAADMGRAEGPAALIDHAARLFGKIDVLINNVGGGTLRDAPADVSDQQWLDMLSQNFLYAVRTCRAAIPLIRPQGGGCIINISSVSARMGDPGVIDYAASKAALESFSKSLSIALAPDGIRVNTVAPGPVTTPLWTDAGGLSEQFGKKFGLGGAEAMQEFARHVPLGRFAEAAEIAALVFFLASNNARIITGSNFRADGGLLAAV